MTDAPTWPRAAGRGPVVVLGKLVADAVLELSEPLVVGGQQRVVRTTTAGGAPANVTSGLARLGVPAVLAGWAGADPLADGLLAGLAARGVDLAVVRRGRTPLATVLVHPDGERTLLSDRGDGGLEPDDVAGVPLPGTAVLHLDGYDLLRFPDALAAAADRAHGAGVPVSLDVAAATRVRAHGAEDYAGSVRRLRPDLLLCNAAEARVLGLEPDGDLPPWAPDLVVVHAGPEPTAVRTRGGTWRVPVPPVPVPVRDTTGCGDALAAGVLAGWRAGDPVLDAVRGGHAAAAVVAGVIGAQPPS
ncbi:carbohydrate kinase family protein [Geodermatophilus marinus]|uniref:carbohydrate kinase family protein n=1 Tax=Geodermatophilus sp. LHW52908 TaxID=2303986 RepID=UPI0011C0D885|nr:carbohydrate kinase family protein [Geodermatophilus sp. LHW52908]